MYCMEVAGFLHQGEGRMTNIYINVLCIYINIYIIYINVFPVEHFATCDIEAKGDEIWTFPHQIVQSCVWCIQI